VNVVELIIMIRRRGRPKKGLEGLDKELVRYLLSKCTGAPWGELLKDTPQGKLHSGTLKKALDRLMDAGIIGVQAERIEGKTVVLYAIKNPILKRQIPGMHIPLLLWIEAAISYLENGGEFTINKVPGSEDLDDKSKMVVIAIRWLGTVILKAMNEAVQKPKGSERNKYVDQACNTYIYVLISALVDLVSHGTGDTAQAIQAGIKNINPWIFEPYISSRERDLEKLLSSEFSQSSAGQGNREKYNDSFPL
jgi:hypothetical protein